MNLGKDEFKKVYPAVSVFTILWWLPVIIALTIAGLLTYYIQGVPLPGIIIGYVSAALMTALGMYGFFTDMGKRRDRIRMVYAYRKNIAYMIHPNLESEERGEVKRFIKRLLDFPFSGAVYECLDPYVGKLSYSAIKPYVMLVFKAEGTVEYEVFGRPKKAHGFQSGRHLSVEWLGEENEMPLVCEELAHIFIWHAEPKWSEKKHHEVISMAGVTKIQLPEKI